MQPEPMITHQICTAATNSCQSAADFALEHPPYCHWLCGQRITILDRPLAEAEWRLIRAFAQRLKRNDVSLRFGRALDLEDNPTLRRYFDIKADGGEITWVLDETDAIIGVSHRVVISHSEAEIALIVRSDLKRLGIGELLLRKMLARSAHQDLKTLSAWVSRENRPVLRLAEKVGYVARDATQWAVEVTFDVRRATAPTSHPLDTHQPGQA
jgi:GNAT superfamily N-acetyltransferase